MEFFNKKEEVIDLKLTQFGRFLLSKGRFKPTYYSFYDDNVIYDVSRADMLELQNDSEERIRTTPTMHPQISISSLEKQFNENYNKVLSGEASPVSVELQRTAEKHYFLPQPIGTSNINSEYSPSWSTQFLNGTLTGSLKHLNLKEKTGGANTQRIPQLSTEMVIEMIDISSGENDFNLDEFEDGFAESNVAVVSEDNDLFILLKVTENNGTFQKKNFDIEFFEIEEEQHGGTTIENLRPLSFSLAQEATSEVSFVDDVMPDSDITYVDYYFDVLVDDEISDKILCEYDPVKEKMGVFSDPRTKLCQDVINEQKKKVFDIYKDESDSPGEVC